MNKKTVVPGLFLIVLACYYLCYKLELIPEEFSTVKVILTIVCVFGVVNGVMNRSFLEIMCAIAVVISMYASLLDVEQIAGLPIIFAFAIIGVGLDMVFKGIWKKKEVSKKSAKFENPYVENVMDGEQVVVRNNFSHLNKYVNSNFFQGAKITNNFGKCDVYFNNAILGGSSAVIDADNSFGEMNLYLPSTWHVDVRQNESFGNVKYKGMGSMDPQAPVVTIHANVHFGEINICFE